jgi:hypothetical protein
MSVEQELLTDLIIKTKPPFYYQIFCVPFKDLSFSGD